MVGFSDSDSLGFYIMFGYDMESSSLTCRMDSKVSQGFPVYLQQLLHEGNLLVDDDKLAGPMDVQLVLLTISDPATRLLAEDDLSKALRSNHVEMARFLLKAGVDGDRRDSNGCTALMRGI